MKGSLAYILHPPAFTLFLAALDLKVRLSYIVAASESSPSSYPPRVKKYLLQV
jgi:hypothetical protein